MCLLSSLLTSCAGEVLNHQKVQDGKLGACPPSPNCVSSQGVGWNHIDSLTFNDEDPHLAFAHLKQILMRRSDTKVTEDSPGYLRVEFHTTLFVDDGEFLLDEKQRTIQVGSASRLGVSDLGKNRSRIEEIRREFTHAESKP